VGRAHSSESDPRAPRKIGPESGGPAPGPDAASTWIWGVALTLVATALRLVWVLDVPTVPVSDFAMYRESANYLSEFGSLDHGFIYMPGFVVLLAWIRDLGGDLLAQKIPGVVFGGLGAAGLFVLALRLFESRRVAVVATLGYAVWPAGIAMSSVVGTDVPASALLAVALAVLATLGPRRPWTAALLFGAVMGAAAWVRAVALPLSALSLGYWLARRTRWPAALTLTAASVAATLLALLPWGLRHVRESGHLYFTDDHGGITALIGANPNSEGTYTRALNQMFHDLTGRGVLDEPHHESDRAAYALAREWTRFSPRYALGLAAKKAERLFEPERRLLYWSIFRPGVLVGPRAAWFDARREPIGAAADAFGAALAALAAAGLALAVARRRWAALVLAPFQLALAATYTIFFAEPRYRLPIELLAFPFAALTLVEAAGLAAALARRAWPEARVAGRALALGGVVVLAGAWAWPALLDAGAALRARHRWGATVWRVDHVPRLAKWRATDAQTTRSPVEAGSGGVRLTTDGQRPTTISVELGGGPVAAGTYALALDATAKAPVTVRLTAADGAVIAEVAVSPEAPLHVLTILVHGGGVLRLTATLTGGSDASVLVSDVQLNREPAPDPRRPGS
jgi:hypothetical protein